MTSEKRKTPKEYMNMAVDVMKKSISESNKSKPSPHVGAVLVFPDGTVNTAYRGELREGDHAEYTVLDKKTDTENCPVVGCLQRLNHVRRALVMLRKSVVRNVL